MPRQFSYDEYSSRKPFETQGPKQTTNRPKKENVGINPEGAKAKNERSPQKQNTPRKLKEKKSKEKKRKKRKTIPTHTADESGWHQVEAGTIAEQFEVANEVVGEVVVEVGESCRSEEESDRCDADSEEQQEKEKWAMRRNEPRGRRLSQNITRAHIAGRNQK